MTIEKLAILLVAEWFDSSPGSERAQAAIERTTKDLKTASYRNALGQLIVPVEVEG